MAIAIEALQASLSVIGVSLIRVICLGENSCNRLKSIHGIRA
jgi:hypothetical protein